MDQPSRFKAHAGYVAPPSADHRAKQPLACGAGQSRRKDVVDGAIRRAIDVVVAAALLLLLLPLFVVIALLVVVDAPGPVLFIQKRIGRDGREFQLLKFRSMVYDAEARRTTLEAMNERGGPVFKIRRDPRITRVGRHLRRTSLDELPQFLNVLRGEMGLVGPRPALPAEVAQYTPRQHGRLAVAPGLTGLAQISGRAALPFEQSVEMDLDYIARRSVALDLCIMLRTVPAVLSMRGAY